MQLSSLTARRSTRFNTPSRLKINFSSLYFVGRIFGIRNVRTHTHTAGRKPTLVIRRPWLLYNVRSVVSRPNRYRLFDRSIDCDSSSIIRGKNGRKNSRTVFYFPRRTTLIGLHKCFGAQNNADRKKKINYEI